MAQRAFVRVRDVDTGDTRSPTITINVSVLWYGDALAGPEDLPVTLSKSSTANQINTAITNAVIARCAAQTSTETMTSTNIQFIDRFV